jgi:hypothetical protein
VDLGLAVYLGWGRAAVGVASKGLTAAQRIYQLAETTLTRFQRERVITLGLVETEEGVRIIASSEVGLRPLTLRALEEGEIAVTGVGHAEITGYNAARELGLTPTGIAASRPICPTCQLFFKDLPVKLLSPLGRK